MLTPFTTWARGYTRELFKADLVAGFVVAIVLIPQAMAYALLAGLPPVAGFYAALAGTAAASLWGSSALLSTGPVAIVSFLVFSTLVPLAEPGSAEYIALASVLAVLSGLMLFALGMFRLGSLMRFIPHAVVTGFASAAAIIIAITQLPSLMGFVSVQGEFMLPSIVDVALHLPAAHIPTALVGILSLALLWWFKRAMPHVPAALIVLLGSVGAAYVLRFDQLGIALVGSIPATLPLPDFSTITFVMSLALLSKALVIAIVGFVGTYSIAHSFQNRRGRQMFDVNQELVGQGIANILAGIFRGFPVSGSFSRTAINTEAGAKTGISSVCASSFILVALFVLGPALALIPLATLAAVIIVSVIDLIEIKNIRVMYHLSHTDGVVAIITFATALIVKPDDAVLIGVIVALALFIQRLVRVKVRILGIESEWNILQGVETSGTVETFPGVLIIRAETSAFYGNIEIVIRKIDEALGHTETIETPVKYLVIDCSSITYMDLSGAEQLLEYAWSLKEDGISIYAIYVHHNVHGLLDRMNALGDITVVHNIAEMRALLGLETETARAE